MAVPNIISGNLTASVSDHLPKFLPAPNIFSMLFTQSQIIMKETGQDLIKKTLYLIISWITGIIFCFHQTQTLKNPIKDFLEKIESLLDTYAPLKNIFNSKLKFRDKTWKTPGLQKSISIKNQFLSKFTKLKDHCKKR